MGGNVGKVSGKGGTGERATGFAGESHRPAKRKKPTWAALLDGGATGEYLLATLPRPLSGETLLPSEPRARFPQLAESMRHAGRILAGELSLRSDLGGTASRLGTLAVLLDALGRGACPQDSDRLRSLWSDLFDETARLDSTDDAVFENSLAERLSRAEVLIASGVLFAGMPGMRSRAKAGRKRLWEDLRDALDTDGTPSAGLLETMPACAGAVVRGAHWCERGGLRRGKTSDRDLFADWLRVMAALVRPDGSQWGTDEPVAALLVSGMRLLEWKTNDLIVSYLRQSQELGRKTKKLRGRTKKKLAGSREMTAQSEWAKLMVARSDWDAESDLFFLRHDGRLPEFEWSIAGRTVASGEWGLEVAFAGEPVEFTAEWEAVSWFEDREVVYLELQWTGREDLVICRQVLFSRSEQQLWLADAISAPGTDPRSIMIRSTIPLLSHWNVEHQRPLREFRFVQDAASIRGFPLTFPMEYIRAASGEIHEEPGAAVIQRTGQGGIYCPLLFDWHGPRQRVPADWRVLTVTEDGRKLTEAEAAAARVRLGPQQWVVYRNMNASAAMRAVIGYHHNQESVFASFTKDGEVDPLVLVESTDEQET